jgi:hypothetical protein
MNQERESYRQDLYMSVGVIKDYKRNLRNLHGRIRWVGRGTGTPKDKDEMFASVMGEYVFLK